MKGKQKLIHNSRVKRAYEKLLKKGGYGEAPKVNYSIFWDICSVFKQPGIY